MRHTKLTVLGAFIAALLLITPLWVLADVAITITILPMVAPTVVANPATDVTYTSGTLQGEITKTGNNDASVRGFEWGFSTGNYTQSWNETGTYGVGTFSHTVGNLTPGTCVFYMAFAINTIGRGNSTEMTFCTSTLPGPPTDFTITQAGPSSIELSWTMGTNANTTIIRGSEIGYPTNITEGYLVYSGNETSVVIDGFDFDTSVCYYRAWSHNDYGYSLNYAEAFIGDPIGLPTILFVIGLCGFALWKKDWTRTLLSVCIIIWGAFAMGTILFIMSIMRRIQTAREEQA
jgi:hypothetical protein